MVVSGAEVLPQPAGELPRPLGLTFWICAPPPPRWRSSLNLRRKQYWMTVSSLDASGAKRAGNIWQTDVCPRGLCIVSVAMSEYSPVKLLRRVISHILSLETMLHRSTSAVYSPREADTPSGSDIGPKLCRTLETGPSRCQQNSLDTTGSFQRLGHADMTDVLSAVGLSAMLPKTKLCTRNHRELAIRNDRIRNDRIRNDRIRNDRIRNDRSTCGGQQ